MYFLQLVCSDLASQVMRWMREPGCNQFVKGTLAFVSSGLFQNVRGTVPKWQNSFCLEFYFSTHRYTLNPSWRTCFKENEKGLGKPLKPVGFGHCVSVISSMLTSSTEAVICLRKRSGKKKTATSKCCKKNEYVSLTLCLSTFTHLRYHLVLETKRWTPPPRSEIEFEVLIEFKPTYLFHS